MFLRLLMTITALLLGVAGAVGSGAEAAPAAQRYVIVPGQSSVTYRVNETLFNEGNRLNTAVGVTTAVRGAVLVDRARPASSRIEPVTVDISQFKSDKDRRDRAIRERWLESATYPTAIFTTTGITGLPTSYRDGQAVQVQITGTLKVRTVTRPTTWTAIVVVNGDRVTVTGRATVRMTDFGFDPPALFFLKTEDQVRLEFRLVARR